MKTYQIGNKVTCIIRAFCPSIIGGIQMQHDNEPYTILKDVSVSMTFTDSEENKTSAHQARQLNFNTGSLNQVRISNVQLTNKVLGMLFNPNEIGLKSHFESVIASEDGHIFLNTQEDTIYQVFIYDDTETMIEAYGEKSPNEIILTPDKPYLIVYQTLGSDSLGLSIPNNTYFTLDLICEGNTDEITAPTYVHIHKAGLRSEKSLYFNRALNAVDLTFNVIATKNDYIVLD